ncbi:hypothetical protein ACM66B_000947 [Microbotryomycetes sp. NB124-2]
MKEWYSSSYTSSYAERSFSQRVVTQHFDTNGFTPISPADTVSPDTPASLGHASSATLCPREAIPSRVGNFDLVVKHQWSSAPITVAKWRSKATGLSVVWADIPGPLISASLRVITEINDNSGRPHTLEHLTFMGSHNYPYKGFLDKASGRSLGDTTNAWTMVDNTTYTTETASEAGILTLLPIYLDHIFQPTLTNAAFVTEVFHVDEDGAEGGVVYSEMQGSAGSSTDVISRTVHETLYSMQNGMRSETGGMLDALRKLTLEEIREYHHAMYVPQNVTVVILGQAMRPEMLLQMLSDKTEPMLTSIGLAKGPHPPNWRRPFIETASASHPPRLTSNIVKVIEYAERDESVGEIEIDWVGPSIKDLLTLKAIQVLMDYLCASDVSPLCEAFVNSKDPSCSSIGSELTSRDPSLLNISASSVARDRLDKLPSQMRNVIADVARRGIDMRRMRDIIHQSRLTSSLAAEEDPREAIATAIFRDTIWGNEDGSDLVRGLETDSLFDVLAGWTSLQWSRLINEWFVQNKSLTIIGKPSKAEASRQVEADKLRVQQTLKATGPEGARKRKAALDSAVKQNSKPIPSGVLESIKIPDTRDILWYEVETARARGVSAFNSSFTGRVQDHVYADPAEPPFFIQFDHVESKFVEIRVVLHAPPPAHELLRLYIDVALSLPLVRDGVKLSYAEATKQIEHDLLWRTVGTEGEGMLFTAQAERSKYSLAISWLRDTIYNTIFDPERLINSVKTSITELPAQREDDAGLASAAQQSLICLEDSVVHQTGILNVMKHWPKLLKRLQSDPKSVVKDLENLRKAMTDNRSMRIGVVGNILALDKPSTAWVENFVRVKPFKPSELVPIVKARDVLTHLGREPSYEFVLYESPAGKSSYSRHMAKGCGCEHPDWPALEVAISMLDSSEGPLWTAIRGPGLAYGAWIAHSIASETTTFVVFKSPDAFAAFNAARDCVHDIINGKFVITEAMLEETKSTMTFYAASADPNQKAAAIGSFIDVAVKLQEIVPVIKKWIAPIFDPATSIGAASVGVLQRDHIVNSFTKLGYHVHAERI